MLNGCRQGLLSQGIELGFRVWDLRFRVSLVVQRKMGLLKCKLKVKGCPGPYLDPSK